MNGSSQWNLHVKIKNHKEILILLLLCQNNLYPCSLKLKALFKHYVETYLNEHCVVIYVD